MAAALLASQKIEEAKVLLGKIDLLEGVKGTSKLQKRIKAEINFLNKAIKKGTELEEKHVLCSNLGQLGALYDAATQASQVIGVLQTFSTQNVEKIVVDVIAEGGKQWIKVILRCPKALHLLYVLGGRKGVKPLNEVAEDFLVMADLHPVFYCTPQVVFWFFSGVSESLAYDLEENLGVLVKGNRIPDEELDLPDFTVEDSDTDSENLSSEIDECIPTSSEIYSSKVENTNRQRTTERSCTTNITEDSPVRGADTNSILLTENSEPSEISNIGVNKNETIKKLNLDVTAIIAYVSATTNGGANFVFADKVLTEQAMWERNNPVKKTLDKYFEGCELLVCQDAINHFKEIINTIGGPTEKKRAKEFLSRVTIVSGEDVFKDQIKISGKVRKLSRIIFGTSHANKAITITSNRGFVRSVEQKGIKPVVLYHEPRALTEMKESLATPL